MHSKESTEILEKVKTLLSDKSKWTQHCHARNSNGESVMSTDPNAVCWCLQGAILKELRFDSETEDYELKYEIFVRLSKNLTRINQHHNGIIVFNDLSSHEEIVELLNKTLEQKE